jgi:hypothetical protein
MGKFLYIAFYTLYLSIIINNRPIVLPAEPESLPVLPPLTHNLVSQDSMVHQLVDLMLLVVHAELMETLLLVIEPTMLPVANQDSTLSMDHVLLVQIMPNHVAEELLPNVTSDSS